MQTATQTDPKPLIRYTLGEVELMRAGIPGLPVLSHVTIIDVQRETNRGMKAVEPKAMRNGDRVQVRGRGGQTAWVDVCDLRNLTA